MKSILESLDSALAELRQQPDSPRVATAVHKIATARDILAGADGPRVVTDSQPPKPRKRASTADVLSAHN